MSENYHLPAKQIIQLPLEPQLADFYQPLQDQKRC